MMLNLLTVLVLSQAPIRPSDLKPNPQLFTGQLGKKTTLNALRLPLPESCSGLADGEVPPVPQVTLVLEAPGRLLVSNLDPGGNPGFFAVNRARSKGVCVDHFASVQEPLNLPAGTWDLYLVPRSARGTWSFSVRDASRPMTSAGPPATTVSLPKGFSPNPYFVRPQLTSGGELRPARELAGQTPAADCGQVSASPAFMLELADDFHARPLELTTNVAVLIGDADSGVWTCVSSSAKLALGPGKHPVHLAGKAASPWFSFRDPSRKLSWPVVEARVQDVPAVLETPWIARVQSLGPRQRSPLVPFDLCGTITDAPDFYLRTTAPLAAASLRVLGGRHPLLMVGPLTKEGVLIGRDDAAFHCVRREGPQTLDGVYAVWVSGPADASPVELSLRLTTPGTRVDPLARVGEPAAGLPLEDRVLGNWYPDFSPAHHQATWLEVPASLVAFRGGTPVLLLTASRQNVDDDDGGTVSFSVMLPGGAVRSVSAAELTTQTRTLVAPIPERVSLSGDAVLSYLPAKDAAQLRQRRAKFETCTANEWSRLDPQGISGRYDLATFRGSRLEKVESLGGHLRSKVELKCGANAFYTYEEKLTAAAEVAQLATQQASIDQVMNRLRLQ